MPSPFTRRALALAACLANTGAASLPAQSAPALSDTLTRRIDQLFADYDRESSPGCALGVYANDGIAYARGYGMANLEHGVPISPRTVFDLGSTSKQFTAMSVVMLAQEGKLSLDDPVRRWIPELPEYGRPITVRQLIHHTSGIRDYLTLMSLRGTSFDGITTQADAVALIARQRETNFDPGSEHLYSNSGYLLLSELVHRVSGVPLTRFARERLFDPLGMRATHVHDDHTMIVPRRATGYAPGADGGFRIAMSGFEQTGDGAVMSTVEDLWRWDRNFYTATVGGRPVIDLMTARGTLTSGDTLRYATGLLVDRYRGARRVRHGGSWAGYRAELMRFPDLRTSVAVLCNLSTANPTALAERVADLVLGTRLAPATAPDPRVPARQRELLTGGKPTVDERHQTLSLAPPQLAAYEGSYFSDELDASFTVNADGRQLVLRVAGGEEIRFTPSVADVFIAEGRSIRFVRDGNGRITGALVNAGRVRNIRLERRDAAR